MKRTTDLKLFLDQPCCLKCQNHFWVLRPSGKKLNFFQFQKTLLSAKVVYFSLAYSNGLLPGRVKGRGKKMKSFICLRPHPAAGLGGGHISWESLCILFRSQAISLEFPEKNNRRSRIIQKVTCATTQGLRTKPTSTPHRRRDLYGLDVFHFLFPPTVRKSCETTSGGVSHDQQFQAGWYHVTY